MKNILYNERGANVVEMALISTILLLLVAGVVDVGRAFQNYIIITNAARKGARQASRLPCVGGNQSQYRSAIVNAAIQEASGSGMTLTNSNVTITPGAGCPAAGGNVEVTVNFDLNTFMGAILGASELPMQSTTSMVHYGNDQG